MLSKSTLGIFLLLGLSLQIPRMAFGQMEEEEGGECGGAGSTVAWVDINAGLQYYSRCSYPTDKLNLDCILSSCRSLRGVCPLTSNRSVDEDALSNAVAILNACIAQESLICGINMARTPLAHVSFTTTQLFPPEVANGTVTNIPGSVFLYNLSNTEFSLPRQGVPVGSIALLIAAPNVVHEGNLTCSISVAPASFVNAFKGLLPAAHTVPSMHGVLRLNLSATVSIDLSSSPSPSIKTMTSQSDIASQFTNFISDIGVQVPSTVVQPFNDAFERFFKASVIPFTTITFLSTYAALGLKGAQQNCP